MRSRSSTSLSGRPSMGLRRRSRRLRSLWMTHAEPVQRAVGEQQHGAAGEQPEAHDDGDRADAEEVALHGGAGDQDRDDADHRQAEQGRRRDEGDGGDAGRRPDGADARLAQHVELHGAAGGGAARDDAAEGVAGQLGRRDREPGLHVEGQPQERPHAGEAGELGEHDRDAPQRVDVPELGAGREDRGEARPHDVQAERRQAQDDGTLDPHGRAVAGLALDHRDGGLRLGVGRGRQGLLGRRVRARWRRAGPPGCGTS